MSSTPPKAAAAGNPAMPDPDTTAAKTAVQTGADTVSSEYNPMDPSLGPAMSESLQHIVNNSANYNYTEERPDQLAPSEVRADAVHSHGPSSRAWISHFFPSAATVDRLFAYEHMGSYVIERKSGEKFFESMPLYVRVGMHLLFVSASEFMSFKRVERLLQQQSVRQGQIYDQVGPTVLPHIQSFIRAYKIPLQELLEQDLTKYLTFNSFFARKLLQSARPIAAHTDPSVLTSPADCRLGVFQTVASAKKLWIKGQQFTIPNLLLGGDRKDKSFESVLQENDFGIAVCRLAPQDYHRFHSPFDGVIRHVKDIAGDLYTVNPQAVNEDLNVFTLNKRSVMLIDANLGPGRDKVPVAFVAIGAMMVGTIGWSKKPGDAIKKGEELGWFQYGGSTVVVVVPTSCGIQFDKDLLETSEKAMETLVRVGMQIGRVQ